MVDKELSDIKQYVELRRKIPRNKLIEWMQSDSIDVLGATFIIFDKFANLVESMPEQELVISFYKKYFRRCILEDPKGEFAEGRYLVGYTLTGFYKALRNDKKQPQYLLKEIRDLLATLYKQGSEDVKLAIINGALEHLFEDKEVKNEFADWRNDKELSEAYLKAAEWSEKQS
jgi:hypothetical protein